MEATKRQISYLQALLGKQGWDTRYIGSSWKSLGFSMRERSGRVENLTKEQASRAISALKALAATDS